MNNVEGAAIKEKGYFDEDIREEVKESMRLPWMKRPYIKTNAINTTPKSVRLERRNRKLLRMWYNFCDDWGNVALCVMIATVGFAVILLWATWPR